MPFRPYFYRICAALLPIACQLWAPSASAEASLAPGFLCLGESESLMRGTSLDEMRRERDIRLAELAAKKVAAPLVPHTH